jgi:hypothetical protein
MRKLAGSALLATAVVAGTLTPAFGQETSRIPPPIVGDRGPAIVVDRGTSITPLGWFVIGSVGCMAVSPMIATAILGRELTLNEAYRSTFGCVLGPAGWLLADLLVPPTPTIQTRPGGQRPQQGQPPQQLRTDSGRNFRIPRQAETQFVANEILLQFAPGTTAQMRNTLFTNLQLTELETQTFQLTGRRISRLRIDGPLSVPATLSAIARNYPAASGGWPNMTYVGVQAQPTARPDAPTDAAAAQYVVKKLHLLEAHRISSGEDVLVAVIDSKIDTQHPDLKGAIADEYDVDGTPPAGHSHGTAMAGAIAAQGRLVGVAPKVKLRALFPVPMRVPKAPRSTFSRALTGPRASARASLT